MVEPKQFIEEKTTEVQKEVGDSNAIIALSGGVDSSTTATIAYEAIGDQLTPVYIDTGLMRKGETKRIQETFDFMDSLRIVNGSERFLDVISGVTDPEEKRKVIGEQFIREFETIAEEDDADYLIQGTIYPDRVESEGDIKSHHNVGGLPEVIGFDGIVEPVRDLYKDEVREVARELGLESVISERMPFPGPGLAIRMLGEVTEEKLEIAREATVIVESELEEYDPWQAFPVVLGKATGVKGDNRVHGWVVAVRSVESRDGMTAQAQNIDWDTLQQIQSQITSSSPNVSRVVYDVTPKPPSTIEYE